MTPRSRRCSKNGDLLIDGGNSLYNRHRAAGEGAWRARAFGLHRTWASSAVQGRPGGAKHDAPGGHPRSAYDAIEGLVRKMAAQVEDGPCVQPTCGLRWRWLTSSKTVHNGIEYGIEQILCEAYDLMERSARPQRPGDGRCPLMAGTNGGALSYLVESPRCGPAHRGPRGRGGDLVERSSNVAGQKGTGLWNAWSAPWRWASRPDDLCGRSMAGLMSSPPRERAERIQR